jgi:5-methylcytosine-specific restriction endonuclease McrA
VAVWGVEGTLCLLDLSKRDNDIQVAELVEVARTYYIGKSKILHVQVNSLKTSLRILGYKGKFIGRTHVNRATYFNYRRRENAAARRWGFRNSSCDNCGNTENLRLHHIVPLSWGGKSTQENCTTLCEKCHRKVHKKLSLVLSRERLLKYLEPHYEEIEILAKQSMSEEQK